METWIGIAVIAGLIIYAVLIFNRLVTLKNRFKNAWSQIDVQLQRRYDLIPNLVATAQAYLDHEKETLTRVIEARNGAKAAAQSVKKDPSDQRAVQDFSAAEAVLGQSLLNFNALTEAYPNLTADATMMELMQELTTTENKISFARQAFNDAIMDYNTAVQVFPNSLIATNTGHKSAEQWQLENAGAREGLRVSFN